jgi:hypothetical protein
MARSRSSIKSHPEFVTSFGGCIRFDLVVLADVPVEDGERLARMILTERWVNRANMTPKPLAFLPYSLVELSVIRHREINETELWEIGREISVMREAGDQFGRKFPLVGRGDFLAQDVRELKLDVKPVEGEGLPRNHADVVGWPPEKPAQMMRAIQIAARAAFVPTPVVR